MLETPFYIACLRLSGRRCVVIGGGEVGLEKVEGLLACDADVTLVAPEAHPELVQLALEGSIRWERREYESGDLDGALIAIAATDDTDLNIRVFEDAEARSMLVNVVDVPPLCNFILPAIVRTGPLAVAISTAGASPALAKRMKREIAESCSASRTRCSRSCSTTRAAGRRRRSRPTRTARSSSSRSSTASPTRSSCCGPATSRACAS